jgi:hypothetical protein
MDGHSRVAARRTRILGALAPEMRAHYDTRCGPPQAPEEWAGQRSALAAGHGQQQQQRQLLRPVEHDHTALASSGRCVPQKGRRRHGRGRNPCVKGTSPLAAWLGPIFKCLPRSGTSAAE